MLSRFLPAPGPSRTITGITLVHTMGQGLWMAISAIYATRVIGLSPTGFGLGVAAAAAVSLAMSTPTGHLADRVGPRTVQVWSFVALGPLTAALLLVHGFTGYVVVMAVQAVAYSASRSARMAMIAGVVPAAERVRTRAYLRATTNVSVALGAAVAGGLLIVGTDYAYRWAVAFNAATYTAAGLLTVLLPAVPPQPARPGPRLEVLRDRPFLSLVVVDGVLSMHNQLLDVVLPLWVIDRTSAPRWMAAAVLLLNTGAVVLFQVRISRGTDEPRSAARAVRHGGLFLALACVVFGFSGGVPALEASVLLALGAVAHVMGEIRQAAGSWGVSFGLAPDHAQGQYQGTYQMGADLGKLVAPAVLTWLAVEHGRPGWWAMAIVFAASGTAFPPLVAWARRRGPALPEPVEPAAEAVR
ncbi:MFS transporter [Streptomyces sp. ICBB 8177]|uniref:MFS transporter n=1 Tax=Streptomyces sp. ICBB 8177 TaxID=563922 RepID=UPI000D684DC0|nr:MFS transporter [Streptomyces sp. ICBB 8177]PWI45139.1 MFS transporter [Streptomyces sp. ICBB 8177]